MTTYPVFASGIDAFTGATDTLFGTIEVTNGFVIDTHLQVNSYVLPSGVPISVFSYYTAFNIPLWSVDITTVGFTFLLGTRGVVPTVGADIFGFTLCCHNINTPAGGSNYFTETPPLGTIAYLPLPLNSVPISDLGTGWTSLVIIALLGVWFYQRLRPRPCPVFH